MKKLLALFLIATQAWAGLPPPTVQGQSDTSAKTKFNVQAPNFQMTDLGGIKSLIETGNTNVLINPGFEGGTTGWTTSGTASLTIDTTAARVGSGKKAGDITFSANNDAVTSTAWTVTQGQAGQSMFAVCNIQNLAGSGSYELRVVDGSGNVLSKAANDASTNQSVYIPMVLSSFTAPAQGGTVALKIISTGTTNAGLNIDDCFLGKFGSLQQIGQVSQAQLYGSVVISGCASNWAATSTGYTDFTAQTGCTYTTSGNAVADTSFGTAQLPAIKFSQLPPGEYQIVLEGSFSQSTGGANVQAQFSDGTNTAREQAFWSITVGTNTSGDIVQSINYTTAQTNVTLRPKVKASSGSVGLYGTATLPTTIKVYRFPTSSELAYRPDVLPASWSGSLTGSGGGWTNTNSGGFSDFSVATTSTTLTQLTNTNFGTVTAESTKLPGITFTPNKTGSYLICASVSATNGTTSSGTFLRLIDSSSNIINAGVAGYPTGGAYLPYSLCGIETVSSTSAVTLKIQGVVSGGSTGTISQSVSSPITWSITALSQQIPAPLLMGSVTSTSAGQWHEEGVQSSTTCTTGTCATNWNSSGAAINWSATGTYKIMWPANVFSQGPVCVGSGWNGGLILRMDSTSTSETDIEYLVSSTGADSNAAPNFICFGPR